jgi:hypothetical protein
MSITKVNADVLDLTDAYAFTGDVTGASKIVQVVNTTDVVYSSGTTVMPWDDTIPQNTEGDEHMSLAITPTNSSNNLLIEVQVLGSTSSGTHYVAALFQDSTAGSLAAGWFTPVTTNTGGNVVFTHFMAAGTTSATTFKVRCGPSGAATFNFNGYAGARKLGSVGVSSITITEISV